MKERYFIGINEGGDLFSVEITAPSTDHPYFSICGQTDHPLSYKEAIERTREQLEDGEFWKMAVEAGRTTLGLNAWIEYIIAEKNEKAAREWLEDRTAVIDVEGGGVIIGEF